MCYAVIPEEHHQLNNENINPNDDSPNQRWITELQHCAATRTNFGEVKLELCPALQLSIECLGETLEDIWQAKLSSYTFFECQILNQARDCIHHHLSSCESPPELLNVLNQLHRNVIRDTPCDGSENANDP
ncbi:hypothetical protein pipiens_015429 [Culex pipiens pipiens]|uniref:Uncharacterized protein n=1 Tax=Culex pipiens pipiens TaxID=38569 RepID=A0ABD1CQN0_CULPP